MTVMFRQKHMANSAPILGPKIVFSYGMTKSGSTLAFEIARTGLELSGFAQPKLNASPINTTSKINFIHHLTDTELDEIWSEVQEIGHPIVLKTHQRPDLPVIDMINEGNALVQACYRDPRDIALSMLDHGVRARASGRSAFSEYETLDQVFDDITSQTDSLTQWLIRPNVLPIYFNDLVGRTEHMAKLILGQIGLNISADQVVSHVLKKRFIQFNKGVSGRYKSEMQPEDRKRFRRAFAPFYHHIIKGRDALIPDGRPALPDGTVLFDPKLTSRGQS